MFHPFLDANDMTRVRSHISRVKSQGAEIAV